MTHNDQCLYVIGQYMSMKPEMKLESSGQYLLIFIHIYPYFSANMGVFVIACSSPQYGTICGRNMPVVAKPGDLELEVSWSSSCDL